MNVVCFDCVLPEVDCVWVEKVIKWIIAICNINGVDVYCEVCIIVELCCEALYVFVPSPSAEEVCDVDGLGCVWHSVKGVGDWIVVGSGGWFVFWDECWCSSVGVLSRLFVLGCRCEERMAFEIAGAHQLVIET